MLINELLQEWLILIEGRPEFIATKFGTKLLAAAEEDKSYDGEKDALKIIHTLLKADPSSGKNIQFIVNMYIAKQFKVEDLSKIKSELEKFNKFKARIENKDLNSYKTLDALYDVLETFDDKEDVKSNKQITKDIKSDSKKIIDTPDFKVIVPTTEASAQFYGSGTKWCTAADKNCMFNHYAKDGDLYVIIAKIDGKERKFQLHYESDQFMNERDTEVNAADKAKLSKLDGYNQFLNWLIKKHYEPMIKAIT